MEDFQQEVSLYFAGNKFIDIVEIYLKHYGNNEKSAVFNLYW